MTQPPVPQKPIWAWFVLIFGAAFLTLTAPASIILLLVPFFKPDEISFMSSLLTAFMLILPAAALWAMVRSYKAVKAYQRHQREVAFLQPEEDIASGNAPIPPKTKKPIWPWLVIAPGAALLISSGPGAVMFPIMPLFLAGMSTDSPDTPGYVPALLIFGGYGLMIGYGLLVWRAIRTLRTR